MQPVLKIDLSGAGIEEFLIPAEWQTEFLGGASLAARMLYEDLTPQLDPLSPEAPLLFLNGPLTGTAGPAVGRFVICARSPATGLWGESNCGGFWGSELRMAAYDGILVTGRAPKPVYLWINDGNVEIRPAGHLWGLDTYQTQHALQTELGEKGVRVASIGPAGERLIPFSLILCDHGRVAGRTGMGAVMGSKNLKAVAVKGRGSVPLSDPQAFRTLRSLANRELRTDAVSQVLHQAGTASAADYFDYLGEMPKRYFHSAKFDTELKITGAHVAETILDGVSTCHACVIACGRVVRLEDGERRKGPEYETLVGFGPNLWLNDPAFVTRMGELCDRYGMDTISTSNTFGLAFTLFELGILNESDTGGLALNWGDKAVVEKLIHLTAHREGFGAQLAEGSRSLGRRYGAEDKAVQVNGLEVAYHDPRGASGMALVYATSPRGACHNQSDYFLVDIGQAETDLGLEYFNPHDGAAKAANVARHQDWRTVFSSLVMCIFSNVPPDTLLHLVNSACGLDWTLEDLLESGGRGWNLKRVINNRLGLRGADDKLPQALLVPYDDAKKVGGQFVPDFPAMLEAYYAARGWDPRTGYPKIEKMESLGLGWAVKDLWGQAKRDNLKIVERKR
ncbi:MAG: aldehyde ferredoxin oxidoreductase family protein [Anaerolineales bacterium]|jgi:aldehyde:ferredoxin oxidoreductase